MGKLITRPNLTDPDATYARLIAAHSGLTEEQSADFNARLLLTLVNHIGDITVLEEAIALANGSAADG